MEQFMCESDLVKNTGKEPEMEHNCMQCPRLCGVDRAAGELGFCGVPWEFLVARAALHKWEEPSISGKNGSGTIFFSGCNLRCVFCQNYEVSHEALGEKVDEDRLLALMLRLQDEGAHNINLVTPTPYAHRLVEVLQRAKPQLQIPVVYNCGGYERVETLRELDGLVDVYLPDFKYCDPTLAQEFSGAGNYFEVALAALSEMLRQVGKPRLDGEGMLLGGVIVRHLVLPGHRLDSVAVLQALAERFGSDAFLLSLMSQYTPAFAARAPYKELHRRVTSFEYEAVLAEVERLGFDGYFQSRTSASEAFTPDFHDALPL